MSSEVLSLILRARDEASTEVGKVHKALHGLDGAGRKAGGGLKVAAGALAEVGKVAAIGLAALTGGALIAGKALFDIAPALEQMEAKAKTVFGDQISDVEKWASANAAAMGLTARKATGLAANFGDLLIPMGFTRTEAAKMSTSVVGLSGALAQWSGGTKTAAEVSEILAKAMLGERDGLKALGISINDADVKARLLKNGTDKLTGSALEQAKAVATQQLIFEKSTDAQAAYAKGGDGLLGKQASLKAKFDGVIETLSIGMVPIFNTILSLITDNVVPAFESFGAVLGNLVNYVAAVFEGGDTMNDWLSHLPEGIQPAAESFGNLVVFIIDDLVPAFQAVIAQYLALASEIAAQVLPAVQGIAEKFGALVKVVAELVIPTILDLAKRVWEGGLNKVVDAGAKLIGSVIEVLTDLYTAIYTNEAIMDGLRTAADLIGAAFGFVADMVTGALDFLGDLGDWITGNETIMGILRTLADGIGTAFKLAGDAISGALGFLRDLVKFARDNLDVLNLLGEIDTSVRNAPITIGPGPRQPGGDVYVPGGGIPGYAGGGWVGLHGPEIVRVGERGPEYVTPNNRLGGGTINLNVTVQGAALFDPYGQAAQQIAAALLPGLQREVRRQGTSF